MTEAKPCDCPKPGEWSVHECTAARHPEKTMLELALAAYADSSIWCDCRCHRLGITVDEDEE